MDIMYDDVLSKQCANNIEALKYINELGCQCTKHIMGKNTVYLTYVNGSLWCVCWYASNCFIKPQGEAKAAEVVESTEQCIKDNVELLKHE